ncbi:class I SAM-dependent methyltransferase [Flavobacterium sp.]|uniref:THUMP-like domain-containing protein n=1 Tax=Flavobacterium sp. TaxID=239 RepID=UPI0026221C54|nr:class I SAM-dependent methyltransferase [Flavobacterium sp.]
MSFDKILNIDVQNFINVNLKQSINEIAFKKNPFPDIDYKYLLNQIEAKSKSEKKLPTWFGTKNIIYPPKISIEQTSSELTAAFKSQWVEGETLVDLTGGLGVDSYYFSHTMNRVVHCEHNPELSAIAQHNFNQLKKENITCITSDGLEWLQKNNQHIDWLYIDPSRRNETKGKVFLLADCEPNIPYFLADYWNFTHHILIKTAPLLDITAALRELEFVKNVVVVAVNNEVKELLFILENGWTGPITIHAVAIHSLEDKHHYSYTRGSNPSIQLSLPQAYLYEPNAALLKSGGQDHLADEKQLTKLHPHTHLYTSNACIEFPGRRFKIVAQADYSKETLKEISGRKYNIATRNFPETVETIRKKAKLKDGGDDYLFFVTLNDQRKVILFTKKV